MKTARVIPMRAVGLVFLAWGVVEPSSGEASAQGTPSVTLKVEVDGKVEFGDGKAEKQTQTRSLKIQVTNNGKEPLPAAQVKWTIYGRKMEGNDLVILKNGTAVKALEPAGTMTLATPKIEIEGARDHAVAQTKGKGKNQRKTFKEVPATGKRYYGYKVEVLVDGKQVALDASHPLFKKEAE